jgi:hypothetical protein
VIVVVADPKSLVAETRKPVVASAFVGVPLMAPVNGLVDSPVNADKLGETENESGAPPVVVGTTAVIGTPTVNENVLGE